MEFEFVAALPDLAKVPAQFTSFYSEDKSAGGFKLRGDDPTVKGSVEAIAGLQKALKASRLEANGLKGKTVDLTALSAYGNSVEEIAAGVKAKLDGLQEQIAGSGKARLDLEQVKKDLGAAHAKEIEGKTKTVESLTKQLREVLVSNAIRQALGDQAIDPDLAIPFVERQVAAVMGDDGRYQVYVVNDTGAQRTNGATAQAMTIPELVAEMRGSAKYAPLFKASEKKGSGAQPGGSSGAARPAAGTNRLSATDKIARGLAARSR